MISSKELIEEARRQGYKVELRTLRDYVSRGLLSKPIAQKRQQEKGQGGGMIAFYPDKAKNALIAILKSRNEGLGLEEIKKKLFDHEAWEFFELLSALKRNGVDIIQDYGLKEITTEGRQKLSPFGVVFLKYLYDGLVPADFIKETFMKKTSDAYFIDEKTDIILQGLTGSFQKIRELFLCIYGWDAKDKLKHLLNFALEHLKWASDAEFHGLVTLGLLYGKLDEQSRKTKEGILIFTEAQNLIDRLAKMDAQKIKMKKFLETQKA